MTHPRRIRRKGDYKDVSKPLTLTTFCCPIIPHWGFPTKRKLLHMLGVYVEVRTPTPVCLDHRYVHPLVSVLQSPSKSSSYSKEVYEWIDPIFLFFFLRWCHVVVT